MIRHFRPHWLMPLLTLFAGCATTAPTIPKTVTVTVHVHDPAPAWATDPLPVPVLAGTTVGDHLARENALAATVDLANCARRLLRELGDGQAVDPKACR